LEKFKCIVVVVALFFLLGEGLGLALRFVPNKTDEEDDERVIGLKTLGWSIVGVFVVDELFVIKFIYYIKALRV